MPRRNDLTALRDHLFATLEGLQDLDEPMDILRAKAVADVAKVLVDSAKVEVEYLKMMGNEGASKFLEVGQKQIEQ